MDEPITIEALKREGFEVRPELPGRYAKHLSLGTWLWWDKAFNDVLIEVEDVVLSIPNCKTMNDVRHAIRMFTFTP